MKLTPGQAAPQFSAETAAGDPLSLSAFRGKWVILYFYPRDNTPGCTRQACAFRDSHKDFVEADAVVIGCSTDSNASHAGFATRYELPFYLVSDADHKIAEAYGAWQEKNMYGKKSWGVVRSTFLIDPAGIITHVWPRVKVDGHIPKVLEALRRAKSEFNPA